MTPLQWHLNAFETYAGCEPTVTRKSNLFARFHANRIRIAGVDISLILTILTANTGVTFDAFRLPRILEVGHCSEVFMGWVMSRLSPRKSPGAIRSQTHASCSLYPA